MKLNVVLAALALAGVTTCATAQNGPKEQKGPKGTTGLPALVVVDANGEPVGRLNGARDAYAGTTSFVYVNVDDGALAAVPLSTLGNDWTQLAPAVEYGLTFSSPDCTGQPYINPMNRPQFGTRFAVVLSELPNRGGNQYLYVATSGVPETIAPASTLYSGGMCVNQAAGGEFLFRAGAPILLATPLPWRLQ